MPMTNSDQVIIDAVLKIKNGEIFVIFNLSGEELAGVLKHFSEHEGVEDNMTLRQAYNQLWKMFNKGRQK